MTVYLLGGVEPTLGQGVYVAPSAAVIGDVVIGEQSSVWFGTVIRGDVYSIRIGARTNIQDNSTVHVTGDVSRTNIGDDVTVGHGCIIHGCTVGSRVLVGMGTIILDDAIIEDDVLIGAGSLVVPGSRLVTGKLYVGRPARALRDLSPENVTQIRESAQHYVANARRFAETLGK